MTHRLTIAALCIAGVSMTAESGAADSHQIGRSGVTIQALRDVDRPAAAQLTLPAQGSESTPSAAQPAKIEAQPGTDSAPSATAGNLNKPRASGQTGGLSLAAEVRRSITETVRQKVLDAKATAVETVTAAKEQAVATAAAAVDNATAIAEDSANHAANIRQNIDFP